MRFRLSLLFGFISVSAVLMMFYRYLTADPKFHEGDRVVVVGGFFKGKTGVCTDLGRSPNPEYIYVVQFDSALQSEVLCESDLELNKTPPTPKRTSYLYSDNTGNVFEVDEESKRVRIVRQERK